MTRVLGLARKEFADILRERSLILALATQFFVAAFSAFLTIGLVALYDPEATEAQPRASLAYVGPGGFDLYLAELPNLQVVEYSSADALAAFRIGEVDAVVEEAAADGGDSDNGTRTVTLLLPEDEIRTTLMVTQLKALLRDYERDLRLDRQDRLQQQVIYLETEARPEPYFTFALTVLLPLLFFTPVFLAGAITGDSVTQELRTHTIDLLQASPLSAAEFVVGKLFTPVILAPAQVLLWVLLLVFNGLPVANLPVLLGAALAFALLLASGGIVIALLARREGQAQAAYALLVLFLLAASLLAPRDPLNLVARIGADALDPLSWLSLALYAAGGLFVLAVAVALARRQFVRERA